MLVANHDSNVDTHRLEVLNDKRSGAVQMVKLAEKERDSLEVYVYVRTVFFSCLLSGRN